ncbi:MAG: hypothetical protein IKV62_10555 [Bacteroidales bacterium]|nr:hypothetical protein [Bacteroidales bacterium]
MDIDLLAKMVKEAILDHDSVTLPGVGCFVAELVPSTFSDKGYTINPPYRRLYFSPKQGADTFLADLYARDNQGVDAGMANRILTEFLAEMKEILKVKKTVVFPGLGRLRATRENHFFFVADEDLDIYPEGLGLAPLSLKTHVETPEEVATAVAGLAELIAEPEPEPVVTVDEIPDQVRNDEQKVEPEPVPVSEPEPVVEPEPVAEPVDQIPDQVGNDEVAQVGNDEVKPVEEPVAEPEPVKVVEAAPVEEPEPKPAAKKLNPKVVRTILIVLGAIVALLLLCALLGRIAPGLLDPFLYSREELEILRY